MSHRQWPKANSLLRLDFNKQQTHPRPDDRLLERPIVRRAPTRRPALRSRSRLRATLVPLPLVLACLILRRACGERVHRAPGRRAHRTGAASCAVGAPHIALLGGRSGSSRLRTGRRRCHLAVAVGPPSFLSSLRRRGCPL